MNLLDAIVILFCVAAAFRGRRRGLLGQVFEMGGGFLGLIAGVWAGPRIADTFTDSAGVSGAIVSLFVVLAFLSIGQTLGFMIGHRFGGLAKKANLGGADRLLGSAFGVGMVLITLWLVGSLLVQGPTREIARQFRTSAILRGVNDVLPDPPNIVASLRQYLDTAGFPQVFVGMPPVSAPVDLPSGKEARSAIRAARPSTVRILAPACGGTQLGSGWVSSEDYVVTNAHVVAGARDGVTVQAQSGTEVTGTVVLFDPKTDFAMVHAPGLGVAALPLETTVFDRGEPGATLGYPGSAGGQMKVHAAAVQGTYRNATGYDIYGRKRVQRDVYELRSPVRQGDSGGPFVLPDGRVAGVVFAASTTDGDVGYALTGAEVVDEIERATGRTSGVSTGNCTH